MKKAFDIDPGPDPNPPLAVTAKQRALREIERLKHQLDHLEKTVQSIPESTPSRTHVKGAGQM